MKQKPIATHFQPWKSRLLWTLAVCLLGGLALSLFRLWNPATEVEIVPVAMGPLRVVIEAEGRTRLPKVLTLRMPVSGHLSVIDPREGDIVHKGQLLAQVDPREFELTAQAAAAEVARLEALIAQNRDVTLERLLHQLARYLCQSLEQAEQGAAKQVDASRAKALYAESYLQRMETLYGQKAATEEERDRAQLQYVEFRTEYATSQLNHAMIAALSTAASFMPALIDRFMEERELEERHLQARLSAAKARLAQAELELSRVKICSPIDGVILARYESGGGFFPAGAPLIDVGDLNQMEIEVDVLTGEALRIRPGMHAEVSLTDSRELNVGGWRTFSTRDTVLNAIVARIHPAGFIKVSSLGVEEERVKIVLCPLPEDFTRFRAKWSLGTGYRAEVRIITAEKSEALLLPKNALWRDESGRAAVWRVERGKVFPQPIQLGLEGQEYFEVVEGLAPGDQVVWMPGGDLRPGQTVQARSLILAPPPPELTPHTLD